MRFCPFCSAENTDELAVCQSCGRRLPPLPPRRARNAPPTGVQLPPRPVGTTQPPPLPMRRAGATIPPAPSSSSPSGAAPSSPGSASGAADAALPVPASAPAESTLLGPPPVALGAAASARSAAPTSGSPTSGSPTSGSPTSGSPTSGSPTSGSPFAPPGAAAPSGGLPFAPPGAAAPSGGLPFAPPGAAAPSGGLPFTPPGTALPGPPSVMHTSPGFAPLAPSSTGMRAPAPAAPPTTLSRDTAPGVAAPRLAGGDARALANALSPGPAAQRREPAPTEPRDPAGQARRRSDGPLDPSTPATTAGTAPAAPRVIPGVAPSGPRPAPTTNPPPLTAPSGPRPAPTTNPPPPNAALPNAALPDAASPNAASPNAALPNAASSALAPPPGAPPGLHPHIAPDPPWATGYPRAPVGYIDPDLHASALAVDASRRRADGVEPPPTRIHRAEALADRPFTPPSVSQIPEIPEPTLINAARYTVRFARARWQRRGAIRVLGADIKKDTDALDQVLGALGAAARTAKVDGRVFSGENTAIDAAEAHAAQMAREHHDVDTRKLEENARFIEVERERNTKLGEAERMVDEVGKELAQLETQRRGLRDARKELERRQKAYLKAAEDSEKQATATEQGDQRQDLRRSAEQHRREAAALEPERQEADRGLAAIERPIAEASARLDAAKAELDAAKGSLADAREGHTHRLAELDAEQKRKAREIAEAEAEIARRLVTLGTLVNLNRIEDPQFDELYQRIDRLRGAITARTTEIEKLTAEREAYDRGTLTRGVAVIGGAILLFIALLVILRAVLAG